MSIISDFWPDFFFCWCTTNQSKQNKIRWVNATYRDKPSRYHAHTQNVTTQRMVYLNSQTYKNLTTTMNSTILAGKHKQRRRQTLSERKNKFVGCLTSQQHGSVSQEQICSDNWTCCHIEIEVADQTYLTQPKCTDPIMPGAWQGSHWSANISVTGITQPGKNPHGTRGKRTLDLHSRGGHLNH